MRFCILFILILIAAAPTLASTAYRVTGEVTGATERTITLQHENQTFEFRRPEHLGLVKKGDRVTVIYHLDAEQISPAPESGGALPPSPGVKDEVAPPGATGIPGVVDDRAFYNAKN